MFEMYFLYQKGKLCVSNGLSLDPNLALGISSSWIWIVFELQYNLLNRFQAIGCTHSEFWSN